ncbi:MAG TPA: DNA/RNA non-specific endonuclease [Nonomuraea sp.]|nr:DNA/RNA non-specific endonuclease [Nonomuraea sp.]
MPATRLPSPRLPSTRLSATRLSLTRLSTVLPRAAAAAALLLAASSAVPAADAAPCERFLEPNHTYRANRHTFVTDVRGRPVEALAPALADRAASRTSCQGTVGDWGGRGDWNGGHLIAASFGGVGKRYNLAPMQGRQINQGLMKRVEDGARACLEDAGEVSDYRVRLHYPDDSTVVPDTIRISLRTTRDVAFTLPNERLSEREVEDLEEKIARDLHCGKVSADRR